MQIVEKIKEQNGYIDNGLLNLNEIDRKTLHKMNREVEKLFAIAAISGIAFTCLVIGFISLYDYKTNCQSVFESYDCTAKITWFGTALPVAAIAVIKGVAITLDPEYRCFDKYDIKPIQPKANPQNAVNQ